jgi:transposase
LDHAKGRCSEDLPSCQTVTDVHNKDMYLRPIHRDKDGKRHAYWALMESVRTERGPRSRVVAYLGALPEAERNGVKAAVRGGSDPCQRDLFAQPSCWTEVDTSNVRVERLRAFGGPWLGLEVLRLVGLDRLFSEAMPAGREVIPWAVMAQVLVLCRLCEPSSELHIAEHFYGQSALADLLGVPSGKVNEDRLYRSLDRLLPHKAQLETHLKERLGALFELDYDLLLYDVTSTYFEGEAQGNPLAQRGYSRDGRPDCKQVCIGLAVSRCGMPLGYEVFAGNRHDSTTLEDMVRVIEARYGRANRVWVLDRGMVSEDHIAFLQQSGRRYLVGTPKSALKRFERELLGNNWETIREGLEVKQCPSPDGHETFILCRSADRRTKEKAMHARFALRIREGLEKIATACGRRKLDPLTASHRVGRLMGQNTRAAGLFKVNVTPRADGGTHITWTEVETWRAWSELSEGCYLLRSNVADWTAEELWRTYIQLTEAEAAFRIHKSDLRIRPIWHQRSDRVLAHILVCFLAYVLWKTLAQRCRQVGLGDEPRKVLIELQQIGLVDVVLTTRSGIEIRRRCVTKPTDHQAILLQRLGFNLPQRLQTHKM